MDTDTRRDGEIRQEHEQRLEKREQRASQKQRLHEPSWEESKDSGPSVTELTSSWAGSLSPFGQQPLPLDPSILRYAHPTEKPNRAGLMAGEPKAQKTLAERLRRK